MNSKSYVNVLNNESHQKKENYPAIVLDETCMNTSDYSLALMGKVIEFSALTNLKMVLANEGFESINLKYLGGFWVLIEFKSEDSMKKFNSKMGKGYWFSQLIQASNSFCIDERVSWIDIAGIPLKAWSKNTFNRITSKWGELIYIDEQEEGYFHSKRVCVKTKLVDIICESVKIIIKGKTYWVRAKEVTNWIPDFKDDNEDSSSSDEEFNNEDTLDENGNLNNGSKMEDDSDLEEVAETIFEQQEPSADEKGDKSDNQVNPQSEDPFNIYDILNKKNETNLENSKVEESLNYPPSFTPDKDIDAQINSPKGLEIADDIHDSNENMEGASNVIKKNSGPNNSKVGSEKSACSGYFKKDFITNSGGSFLQVMEELIKVGQTMGYNIEGCLAQKAKKDWVRKLCVKHKSFSGELRRDPLCLGPMMFHKNNATISDYLIIIQGEWIPSGKKTLIISIYAPLDIRDKKMMWEYLSLVISNWKEDVIVMGDFNEVCSPNERYGSVFNPQGANIFNQFISEAGLEEIPLGGYRFLFDHRPILMRESHHDYGPIPFRFYHFWFDLDGFDKFVEDTWMNAPLGDTNAMVKFSKKLRYLKQCIRTWIKDYKLKTSSTKQQIKEELSKIDVLIDKGEGSPDICSKRRDIFKSLQELEKLHSLELSQKTKINSEFPNKLSPEQQSDLENIVTRSEIKKAVWECGTDKSPGPDGFTFGFFRRYWSFLENDVVEAVNTFFNNGNFPKGINSLFITLIPKHQEAKTTKDFRPITLIGCIYKIISKILANRMVFVLEDLVNEVQYAFISKRQILDGPFILNELYQWCSKKKKQTMIFKVDFEKAYDSVRWDYLDDILKKFGFGEKWCTWIRNCLISSKGSILVNGSPTMEFQFHKGLKQGDPLSPFLFILVMESLHISVNRVVEAGLFRGVQVGNTIHISHLFFADDAIFLGHWSDSNIDTIIRILDCFYHASGLKINMSKSKLMGISVHRDNVEDKNLIYRRSFYSYQVRSRFSSYISYVTVSGSFTDSTCCSQMGQMIESISIPLLDKFNPVGSPLIFTFQARMFTLIGISLIQRVLDETTSKVLSSMYFLVEETEKSPLPFKVYL
nr:RNA-directed DNA polymerase, eukaryota, reverse transcriptase zinc-binding domain protein [Tanacetum cinerariifolium]